MPYQFVLTNAIYFGSGLDARKEIVREHERAAVEGVGGGAIFLLAFFLNGVGLGCLAEEGVFAQTGGAVIVGHGLGPPLRVVDRLLRLCFRVPT